jgi:hypothetical protein
LGGLLGNAGRHHINVSVPNRNPPFAKELLHETALLPIKCNLLCSQQRNFMICSN